MPRWSDSSMALLEGSLAQISFERAEFDPAADPPMVSHMLFEQPWYLVGAMMLVGVAAFLWFRSRGRSGRGGMVLLVAALVSGGVAASAELVTTDRERVMGLTRELIDSARNPNAARLDRLLGPRGGVVVERGSLELTRDQLIEVVRSAERDGSFAGPGARFTIGELEIRKMRGEVLSPASALTQVNIVGETGEGLMFPPSWWGIEWERDGDAWRVRVIELLWMQGTRFGR
ncbi:MAG: hypothetical protein ACF8SC_00380 [Phycisphaerales bacterium JB037]